MVPPALDAHGGRAPGPQWLAHYVPSHLRAALQDSPYGGPRGGPGGPSPFQLTAVAFARGGAEVVGSYVGDCVYAFDTSDHARGVEALLSISESAVRWVVGVGGPGTGGQGDPGTAAAATAEN